MANEADLRSVAHSLRVAATEATLTAARLRRMWSEGTGMMGGRVTPLVEEGSGNSVANAELLQAELEAQAAQADAAAETARQYRFAMYRYRRDLAAWYRDRDLYPGQNIGPKPVEPVRGAWGPWPAWVSE